MGKGDLRTRRGKIFRGTSGVSRPNKRVVKKARAKYVKGTKPKSTKK